MAVWQLLVVGLALLSVGYFAHGMRAAIRHRQHARVLARVRGPGSITSFGSRIARAHLTDVQLNVIYTFLRAHGGPSFDIFPSDSLSRDFGVGRRMGVPFAEFLDDLRALVDLQRAREVPSPTPQTVGELVALLDAEAGTADTVARR